MKLAAIYARVSSEQQREEHTIASQTAALIEFAKNHGLEVPREWVFEDQGYWTCPDLMDTPKSAKVRA